MKKLDKLVLGSLMLITAPIYAVPPVADMVQIVRKVTDDKVRLFEKKIQSLIPSERRALAHYMINYIILADIIYASNATDVIRMPYIQYICPRNPGRELQESSIQIGSIFSDELTRIVAPPLEFRYLSEGEMLSEDLGGLYEGTGVWPQGDDYMIILQKLGPLTPIYLDALYNPELVILPKAVVRPIAYPEDVLLFDSDARTPNIKFFQQWYNNICSKYFIDDASATMTSFLYICSFWESSERLLQELQDFSNYLERQNLDRLSHFDSLKGTLEEKFPSQQESIEAAFQRMNHQVRVE